MVTLRPPGLLPALSSASLSQSLNVSQSHWTHVSITIMSNWFLLELNITEPMKHVTNLSTSYFGSYRYFCGFWRDILMMDVTIRDWSPHERGGLVVIVDMFLAIISVVMNLIVISAIRERPKMGMVHILLANLCVSNLISSVLVSFWRLQPFRWPTLTIKLNTTTQLWWLSSTRIILSLAKIQIKEQSWPILNKDK